MLPTNEKAGLGSIYKRIKDDEIGNIDEFDRIGKLFINKNPNVQKSNSNFEAQHLYFLSDEEEIKKGDWFVMNGCIVRQCESTNKEPHTIHTVVDSTGGIHHVSVCEKIIATTDSSLFTHQKETFTLPERVFYLPQIPQEFIEYYVEQFNKGNVISKVMVEYEPKRWMNNPKLTKEQDEQDFDLVKSTEDYDKYLNYGLKINSDNTINIKPIKDTLKDIISKNPEIREEVIRLIESASIFIQESLDFCAVSDEELKKWIEENL